MWPKDVGILAIEIIFPSQYVDQTELESHDGVSPGKYTIGLGQHRMGFCTDREDINSLCLTVVKTLLEHNRIALDTIGRIDVGTETIIDKSKSVKSVLMQLFEPHGHTDIEGLDTTNACYGGTAALFNAINWIESSSWDGRLALAVCGDIAVYASGSARPTGGAGAVAMLIGPDAPLVIDRGLRATYMKHVYDFYKPDLTSEYPLVDGKLSIQCYLSALDNCYQLYCDKYKKKKIHQSNVGRSGKNVDVDVDVNADYGDLDININSFDAILFHTPFCKLVQKSLARIGLNDFLRSQENTRNNNNNNNNNYDNHPELNNKIISTNNNNNYCKNDKQIHSSSQSYPIGFEKYNNIKLENTYFDRDLEKSFMQFYANAFEQKTKPSLLIANQVGNMYTPSVYSGLVSLLINSGNGRNESNNNNNNGHNADDDADDDYNEDVAIDVNVKNLLGKKIALFSYGSGLAASFYSITVTTDYEKLKPLIGNIIPIKKKLLTKREKVSPAAFTQTMESREKGNHHAPYTPTGSIEKLFPGTYYLDNIDDMHRRTYKRTAPTKYNHNLNNSMAATTCNGNSSSSSSS